MYAGAALFKKRALALIDEDNFFASIRRHRLSFRIVRYDGIWLDIGTPATYFQANWDFMAQRTPSRATMPFLPGAEVSPRRGCGAWCCRRTRASAQGASLWDCIVAAARRWITRTTPRSSPRLNVPLCSERAAKLSATFYFPSSITHLRDPTMKDINLLIEKFKMNTAAAVRTSFSKRPSTTSPSFTSTISAWKPTKWRSRSPTRTTWSCRSPTPITWSTPA